MPEEKEEGRIGQRKLNSYANAMGVSAPSPGSSGAGTALQSDVKFKSGYLAFVFLHQLVTCYSHPVRSSITYIRQFPVFDYHCQ